MYYEKREGKLSFHLSTVKEIIISKSKVFCARAHQDKFNSKLQKYKPVMKLSSKHVNTDIFRKEFPFGIKKTGFVCISKDFVYNKERFYEKN